MHVQYVCLCTVYILINVLFRTLQIPEYWLPLSTGCTTCSQLVDCDPDTGSMSALILFMDGKKKKMPMQILKSKANKEGVSNLPAM